MEYSNKNISSLHHFDEIKIDTVSATWKNELFTKINNKPKSNNTTIYMAIAVLFLLNLLVISYSSFNKKTSNISMKDRNELLSNELLVSTK